MLFRNREQHQVCHNNVFEIIVAIIANDVHTSSATCIELSKYNREDYT